MLLARAPGGRSATLGFRPLASVVHPLGLPLTFPRRRFSSGRCVVLCRATSVRTTGHTGRTGPDRTNGAAKVRCPGEGAPPMECSCHARAAAQRPTDESIDRRRGTLARNSFRVDHVTNGSADAAPLFPAPLTGADRRGAPSLFTFARAPLFLAVLRHPAAATKRSPLSLLLCNSSPAGRCRAPVRKAPPASSHRSRPAILVLRKRAAQVKSSLRAPVASRRAEEGSRSESGSDRLVSAT